MLLIGCGKTSLIQTLCQYILEDELAIFRIHAGITNEHIIEKMNDFKRKAEECNQHDPKQRLWIFFDEFNTTSSIGLFKEIICERTLLGEVLPDNMAFLGACNPQRQKTDKVIFESDIGIKKDRYAVERSIHVAGNVSLLYSVVSIPETMLEYVWDFGFLDKDTETKYIETMLNTCKDLQSDSSWFRITLQLVVTSQEFFRENEDVSSVSLRDVARFCRLYNWYIDCIRSVDYTENTVTCASKGLSRSCLIALALCYYFRISSRKQRGSYVNKIETILNTVTKESRNMNKSFIEILHDEQNALVNRMELPEGTAKNRGLIDNIFVLVACIVNRIPVILCGKPGCGKTSSVQIVMTHLKGKKSKNVYFQQLPMLIPVSYQGSQNCTSESVFRVFERANRYIEEKQINEQLLSVIVFDEIGLAELSPHNPLKVLHSELEVDTCRHGFVGLSNWRLDASKMNRALYLACPDPDENDLQSTASAILQAEILRNNQVARPDDKIIQGLVATYHSLYELMNNDRKYESYFGLRDYYAMMKSIVHDLVVPQHGKDLYESIRRHLKANFDGTWDASEYMWETFCEHIGQHNFIGRYKSVSKFDQILDQCLSTRTGRYLMLIGKNESVIDYVEQHIRSKYKTYKFRSLIGSSLSGDLFDGRTYTERYNYKVLMDVILYVETNVTLVMRRMGHLYDNLYDLFNQNFAFSAQKKFCRIALGDLYHPRCSVNDTFYCIVFVQEADLPKCDPPFLNRFEKHVIDMKSLVHSYHWSVQLKLIEWIKSLLPTDCNEHFPLFQHLFVDYSDNYICTLVLEAFEQLSISVDDENDTDTNAALVYCQDKLIETSSLDFPLILSLKTNNNDNNVPLLIDKYYIKHESLLFSSLLKSTFKQTQIPNRVIYTYTQIYDSIAYGKYESKIEEIKLNAFKTELEFTKRIKSHYKSKEEKLRLLLIRVDYHEDHNHILLIKHILLNEHVPNSNRNVWLIFHLQRNILNQTTNDILFNGWSPIMIDDLNKSQLISKNTFFESSYISLIRQPDCELTDCLFDDMIPRCLGKFNYQVTHRKLQTKINDRRSELINSFMNDKNKDSRTETLRSIVHNQLPILIEKFGLSQDLLRLNDWRRDLLTNPTIIGACRSVLDAINIIVSSFYDKCFLLLFAHLEKYSFIDTYQFISSQDNQATRQGLRSIWDQCLILILKEIDVTVIQRDLDNISFTFDLHLPCAKTEYKIIRKIREIISQDIHNNNDDDFDDETIMAKAMEHWRNKSFYRCLDNFQLIENNCDIFKHYYHDQIILALEEAKIYQLSSEFAEYLLMTNTHRSVSNQLQHLLVDNEELFELLRIFEIATELIDEKKLMNDFKQQTIQGDSIFETSQENSELYTLVLAKEKQFYLIPPKQTIQRQDDYEFECEGDPWIETCLMNLIELLVSKAVIEDIKNIEKLSKTYGLIEQGVFGLKHYTCKNLEKLRSFSSLMRCIKTLLSEDSCSMAFQNACRYAGFAGTFSTCDSIDNFIEDLRKIIVQNELTLSKDIIDETLIKLETEFLKNWLIDHSDQYENVLRLIESKQNNLWLYSTKIFLYLDKKFDILSTIKNNKGNIILTDKQEQLNRSIRKMSTERIHHLMVNYIHMHLMVDIDKTVETIEKKLELHFEQFEQNIKQIQDNIEQADQAHNLVMICLIAWIKYYTEFYACAVNNSSENKILKRIDEYKILKRIDEYLLNNESSFGRTIKLFIIKQLCQLSNMNLTALFEVNKKRDIVWIHSMLRNEFEVQSKQMPNNIILPIPLFKCHEEYKRISSILDCNTTLDQLKRLIVTCSIRQETLYCFLIWFINYYSQYSMTNKKSDDKINVYITKNLEKELTTVFEPVGYKFLVELLNNFNSKSYFHLNLTMKPSEIQQRLLALNIFALVLSFKARRSSTYLSSLLFDQNLKLPNNYNEYFQTSVCIPGLRSDNPIITQMIDVQTQVAIRLHQGTIWEEGKFIFKCSENCNWMFYFENCGQPNSESRCPLCHAIIGGFSHKLRIRDPPQIKMSILEANEFITNFIEKNDQNIGFGYHTIIPAQESQLGEKSDHLDRPLSFRFLHILSQGIFLVLHELDLLIDSTLPDRTFFRAHFEKDYELICQQLDDSTFGVTWLFKLLNYMIDAQCILNGQLNSRKKLIKFEEDFEKEFIFNHIASIPNDIKSYLKMYVDFDDKQKQESSLTNLVDEIVENERYPLLTYFNTTIIYTINPIDKLRTKLKNVPYANKLYPMTTFIVENLERYANIRYLYPIVSFTNYLIDKFDHRIKRNDAASVTVQNCFEKDDLNMVPNIYIENGEEREAMIKLYDAFIDAWYKLTLKKVQFGCHTEQFDLNSVKKEDFAKNTKLAMVLLNASKDKSSILLAACLRTIGELQNEVVKYFHRTFDTDSIDNQLHKHVVPLQAIRPEHVLRLNFHDLSSKLILDCFTINYQYGLSKDLIFDYEEIEMTLRKIISCLPLIDTDKMNSVNYQFELYGENSLLITDIRMHVKQESLPVDERKKFKVRLSSMKNDHILNYLGSLDHVFTYLKNIDSDTSTNVLTIQQFAEQNISSRSCLHENIFRQQPFSTIYLKYIVDLYELLEEITFDQVLGSYIPNEYCEKSFLESDRIKIINEFIKSTYAKQTISNVLKQPERWIALLKRIIVRILLNINVSSDVPLQLYLERADLWTGDVTENDIQSFSISNDILLRHTFIILNGLKAQQTKSNSDSNEENIEKSIQNVHEQTKQAINWNEATENDAGSIRVIKDDKKSKQKTKKLRV